jgi:hypothetical protein
MVVQFEKLKMQNTLNRILSLLVLLPAILFVVTGLRWLVAPAGVARHVRIFSNLGALHADRAGQRPA